MSTATIPAPADVRPNDMARLMGATSIVQCDACQRLLYLPDS